MSYETERYDIQKLVSQSLAVIQCGLQICHSGHSCGPFLYQHYSAHFILKGKGVYTVNGTSYPLEAGQGFLITPGITNVYVADKEDPWEYIYATFKGADDDALVHNCGLNEDTVTFRFSMDEDMLHDLHAMHAASRSYAAKGYDVTGYFLLVMSRLVCAASHRRQDYNGPQQYVRRAVAYIEEQYPYTVRISELASFVGVDRTYLYRIFYKQMGMSPAGYLMKFRLKKAKDLLERNDVSIIEIALSTGFYDASHFSKCFALHEGMPPWKYREQVRQKEN